MEGNDVIFVSLHGHWKVFVESKVIARITCMNNIMRETCTVTCG